MKPPLSQKEFNFSMDVADDKSGKIVMHHDFEEMSYSLSNMGQKVLYEVLNKLNSHKSGDNQVVRLTAAELEQIGIGYSKAQVYRAFEGACKEVQTLQLCFRASDADYDYVGRIPMFRASLTKFVAHTKKLAEAYFALSPDAAPYLTDLTKEMRFTTILSEQMRLLKRSASSRLYQWLRKTHWVTIQRPESSVEISTHELMMKLDFSRSTTGWGDFKRYVLDPAVKETNEISDIRCEYQVAEKGKAGKITRLKFIIRNAETFEPSTDQEAKALEGTLINENLPDLDFALATLIRSQFPDIDQGILNSLAFYDPALVTESILDYIRVVSTKDIKKPVDYFLGIIIKKVQAKDAATSKPKTTEQKLTDRSWAEGLDLDNEPQKQ